MPVTPFQVRASDDALEDLRDRVSRARFVAPSDATTWSAGVDPPYLQQLATYWATEFDWRSVEAALDEYPQFLAETDGDTLHFVHIRAAAPSSKRLPVVLLHGWPSTFVEMLPSPTGSRTRNGSAAIRRPRETSSSLRCPASCSAHCRAHRSRAREWHMRSTG